MPNRNADTFADLLRLLRGYPVDIRDEAHRAELLRDARYFHFKGIEQQLIPHTISFNPVREVDEILLKLENVQKSGVSVMTDLERPEVYYARPYVDDKPAQLILEIGGSSTRIHFDDGRPRAQFFRDTRARIAKLLEVIAIKLNLAPTTQPLGLLMAQGGAASQPATPGHTPLSEDLVRVSLGQDAAITLDGERHVPYGGVANGDDMTAKTQSRISPRKRRRTNDHDDVPPEPWTVLNGHWRLKIQPSTGGKSAIECIFEAVRLDAVSSESGRNLARGFLSP